MAIATMTHDQDPLEYIRQVHEAFLTELEGLAVEAIATNNWDAFYAHVVDFQNEHDLHGVTGIAIGIDDTSRGAFTKANLTPDTQCSTQKTEAVADDRH
jgi:hypothetical protein